MVCRSIGQFPGCASCWKAASRLYQGTATVSQKNPQSLTKLSVNVRPRKGKFLMLQPIFLKAFTHQTVVHHKMVLHINGERCHELLQSLAKTQKRSFSSQDLSPQMKSNLRVSWSQNSDDPTCTTIELCFCSCSWP